jgi:hypothetical protein
MIMVELIYLLNLSITHNFNNKFTRNILMKELYSGRVIDIGINKVTQLEIKIAIITKPFIYFSIVLTCN